MIGSPLRYNGKASQSTATGGLRPGWKQTYSGMPGTQNYVDPEGRSYSYSDRPHGAPLLSTQGLQQYFADPLRQMFGYDTLHDRGYYPGANYPPKVNQALVPGAGQNQSPLVTLERRTPAHPFFRPGIDGPPLGQTSPVNLTMPLHGRGEPVGGVMGTPDFGDVGNHAPIYQPPAGKFREDVRPNLGVPLPSGASYDMRSIQQEAYDRYAAQEAAKRAAFEAQKAEAAKNNRYQWGVNVTGAPDSAMQRAESVLRGQYPTQAPLEGGVFNRGQMRQPLTLRSGSPYTAGPGNYNGPMYGQEQGDGGIERDQYGLGRALGHGNITRDPNAEEGVLGSQNLQNPNMVLGKLPGESVVANIDGKRVVIGPTHPAYNAVKDGTYTGGYAGLRPNNQSSLATHLKNREQFPEHYDAMRARREEKAAKENAIRQAVWEKKYGVPKKETPEQSSGITSQEYGALMSPNAQDTHTSIYGFSPLQADPANVIASINSVYPKIHGDAKSRDAFLKAVEAATTNNQFRDAEPELSKRVTDWLASQRVVKKKGAKKEPPAPAPIPNPPPVTYKQRLQPWKDWLESGPLGWRPFGNFMGQ